MNIETIFATAHNHFVARHGWKRNDTDSATFEVAVFSPHHLKVLAQLRASGEVSDVVANPHIVRFTDRKGRARERTIQVVSFRSTMDVMHTGSHPEHPFTDLPEEWEAAERRKQGRVRVDSKGLSALLLPALETYFADECAFYYARAQKSRRAQKSLGVSGIRSGFLPLHKPVGGFKIDDIDQEAVRQYVEDRMGHIVVRDILDVDCSPNSDDDLHQWWYRSSSFWAADADIVRKFARLGGFLNAAISRDEEELYCYPRLRTVLHLEAATFVKQSRHDRGRIRVAGSADLWAMAQRMSPGAWNKALGRVMAITCKVLSAYENAPKPTWGSIIAALLQHRRLHKAAKIAAVATLTGSMPKSYKAARQALVAASPRYYPETEQTLDGETVLRKRGTFEEWGGGSPSWRTFFYEGLLLRESGERERVIVIVRSDCDRVYVEGFDIGVNLMDYYPRQDYARQAEDRSTYAFERYNEQEAA